MTTLSIPMTEAELEKLIRRAEQLAVAPEDLARAGIDEVLSPESRSFSDALRSVLDKNAELYRRLD